MHTSQLFTRQRVSEAATTLLVQINLMSIKLRSKRKSSGSVKFDVSVISWNISLTTFFLFHMKTQNFSHLSLAWLHYILVTSCHLLHYNRNNWNEKDISEMFTQLEKLPLLITCRFALYMFSEFYAKRFRWEKNIYQQELTFI